MLLASLCSCLSCPRTPPPSGPPSCRPSRWMGAAGAANGKRATLCAACCPKPCAQRRSCVKPRRCTGASCCPPERSGPPVHAADPNHTELPLQAPVLPDIELPEVNIPGLKDFKASLFLRGSVVRCGSQRIPPPGWLARPVLQQTRCVCCIGRRRLRRPGWTPAAPPRLLCFALLPTYALFALLPLLRRLRRPRPTPAASPRAGPCPSCPSSSPSSR